MTVLTALIVLNVVVTLLGFRALRAGGAAAERFLFIPAQVAHGQNLIGMLLAHVSHGSVMHLVFNMLALVSFGDGVLGVLGPERFLLVYVVAGLGSDLVVFVLRRSDPAYRCLGASGSVVLDPSTSIVMLFVPVPIPGPLFLIGYGVISVILIARQRRDGISHEGHLGGALLGLVVTALIAPRGLEPLMHWITHRLGG
jgi:membrane associated rhomboid family serine protease